MCDPLTTTYLHILTQAVFSLLSETIQIVSGIMPSASHTSRHQSSLAKTQFSEQEDGRGQIMHRQVLELAGEEVT